MKSKAGVLVLTLLVVGGLANASISTPTITTDSSPLFAVSLNRAVDEFEGRRPKGRSPTGSTKLKAAGAAQGATAYENCTYEQGCMATIGGLSCDFSLCAGCISTFYWDYTCQQTLTCGVFPTQNAGPTCSGFGSTCGSGCSTAQHDNCNNTQSSFCGTFSGSTCASTCSASQCPTSGGTTCDTSCPTSSGTTCTGESGCAPTTNPSTCPAPTQMFSTCAGSFCQELTVQSCGTPSFRPSCEFTSGWECEAATSWMGTCAPPCIMQ